MKRNRYRLDRTVLPEAYDLTLTPDFARFAFAGEETIRLRARGPFTRITLHALELKITRARLHAGRGAKPQAPARITYDAALETVTLHFKRRITPTAPLALELAFEGAMNDKMHGFYRTSYEVRGKQRWGGATQFEATDARRAFPCWDEPDCKATFTVTLRVPRALTALSNMPVVRQRPLPGAALKELRYAPTPRMSTYLLAWVIADLECTQAKDRNGVLVRIWTTKGRRAQGRFALSVGLHALPYFARWFGIPYALPKLDMVALPDFASGAMENWGLVTYRETALLVDPAHSSAPAKQRVAEVIAHELAHQWFGNLVTMGWWTDLWLNEGFASYMGPKAVDDQFPEWRIWDQYVAGEYLGALHEDSLRHTHPIEIPVQNPHEIREIFDSITYSKGSAVNRMLEHYLTEPVFRRGLSQYLKRYAYGNAATGDLWAELEKVSGKPVRAIMAGFTKRPGYPLLTVEAAAPHRLRLTQRRFLASGAAARDDRPWNVPLVTQVAGRPRPRYELLRTREAFWPWQGGAAWLKVNAGQSGFYRTAYDAPGRAALSEALASRQLPALDALGLLDDAFALSQAGRLRTSQALELLYSCRHYADYNLWLTVAGGLQTVERLLPAGPRQAQLWRVGRALAAPLARQLGWEAGPQETHLEALLRALVLAQMGHYRDAATIAEARRRFAAFVQRGTLAPNLRGAVYGIVAEHGDAREQAQLLGIYRRSPLQEERVRVLRALTRFQSPTLIRRTLQLALSPQVRRQDAYVLLGGFGGNRTGRPIAWAFVRRHWRELVRRYASGGLNLMTRVIEGAAGGFTTVAELHDVQSFFARHPVLGTERAMQKTLETIRVHARWAQRDQADLAAWLDRRA